MQFKELFTYKYSENGKPVKVDVDELDRYPDNYVYATFEGATKAVKTLISDLQSEARNYELYTFTKDGTVFRAPKSRTLETSWADKMVRSYQRLHPEQKIWFDMITVDTIADRDALQNDPDFTPESWIRVRQDENGQSHEYVLVANRQFWLDTGIVGLSETSGTIARDELRSRLSSGYLLDTFGPAGQNKLICDFAYVMFNDGDLTARAWGKTGDVPRWDFGDGSPIINAGVPAHTFVPGNNVVTVSTTDSFNLVTTYLFENGAFKGAFPNFDFTNVTNASRCFRDTLFMGKLPKIDVTKIENALMMFYRSGITSTPELNFDSVVVDSFDIFFGTPLTNKIGKMTFSGIPNPLPTNNAEKTSVAGLFRTSTIATIDLDIELNEYYTGGSIFWECTNLQDLSRIFKAGFKHKKWEKWLFSVDSISSTNLPFFNYSQSFEHVKDLFFLSLPFFNSATGKKIQREDMIRLEGIGRNIPPLDVRETVLSYDEMGASLINSLSFGDTSTITSQTINNAVEHMYNRRFITRQTTDSKVFINLQSFDNSKISGKYKNSKTPRSTNEFIYKLVENPDNEDINKYQVLRNTNENQPNGTEIIFDIEIDATETGNPRQVVIAQNVFNMGRIIVEDNYSFDVDWGDGNTSSTRLSRLQQYQQFVTLPYQDMNFSHFYPTDAFGKYSLKIRLGGGKSRVSFSGN